MPRALALASFIIIAGCASAPPPGGPPPAPPPAEPEPVTPLVKATRALEAGELETARRELEVHLDDEPEDAQARYVYAKTLAAQGELRGARAQVTQALQQKPSNPLMWSLKAQVDEQLGEHQSALEAHARVHALVPESLEPILGLARTLLLLGRPAEALTALTAARGRQDRDPWTEYFAFVANRRLGRGDEAETAARAFLELVGGKAEASPAQTDRAGEVRRWLAVRGEPIGADARQAMVDAVRAGLRLRLPGTDAPEDAVLERAPPRLLSFDERAVFVTVGPPGATLRGRGRGRSLASALKGALAAVQEQPGYTALGARDAPVRIDVVRTHPPEPVELRDGRRGLEAEPPVLAGRHGVALRVGELEACSLPADAVTEGLVDVEGLLRLACARAGLAPDAWRQGAARGAFRFETDGWLSPGPGVATLPLRGAEPTPLPQGGLPELREAALAGARWLTAALRPAGERATSLEAAVPLGKAEGREPLEASPVVEARAAWALVRAHGLAQDAVLLAAADHLLGRFAARLEAEPGARDDAAAAAWALLALDGVAPHQPPERRAALERLRATLARTVQEARGAARPAAALALALGPASPEQAAAAERALADLPAGPDADPFVIEAHAGRDALARQAALAWARAEAARPVADPLGPEAGPGSSASARRLAALARAVGAAPTAPDADALAAALHERARALLALQLAPRHRALLREPDRTLGAWRERVAAPSLDPATTAEAVLALVAVVEALQR